MFRNSKYLIISLIAILTAYFHFSPIKSLTNATTFVVLPILFFLFYNKINALKKGTINLGSYYFIAMAVFFVGGNLSSEITKYVFPKFDTDGMEITNLFWLSGMAFFALGYIYSLRNYEKKNQNKTLYKYKLKNQLIYLFLFLSIIATLYSFAVIGFVPFLNPETGHERLMNSVANTTIILRMWELVVITSIFSIIYYISIKRKFVYVLIAIICLLVSLFFFLRIYAALIIFSIGLFLFNTIKKHKTLYFSIGIIILSLVIVLNARMIEYRTSRQAERSISTGQNSVNAFFSDYIVLNSFIRDYKGELYNGETFLSVPAAIVPRQIFTLFGIDKTEILHNTSARIVARFYDSTAEGLRIGLMGEFYLNFGFIGTIFMFFVGVITRYLQIKIDNTPSDDIRTGFFYLFSAILLYSIDAQIDTIGTLFASYVIVLVFLKIILKRQRIVKIALYDT